MMHTYNTIYCKVHFLFRVGNCIRYIFPHTSGQFFNNNGIEITSQWRIPRFFCGPPWNDVTLLSWLSSYISALVAQLSPWRFMDIVQCKHDWTSNCSIQFFNARPIYSPFEPEQYNRQKRITLLSSLRLYGKRKKSPDRLEYHFSWFELINGRKDQIFGNLKLTIAMNPIHFIHCVRVPFRHKEVKVQDNLRLVRWVNETGLHPPVSTLLPAKCMTFHLSICLPVCLSSCRCSWSNWL